MAARFTAWEEVPDQRFQTDRLRVPGGWIVRSYASGFDGDNAIHQIFIADEIGLWKPKLYEVSQHDS